MARIDKYSELLYELGRIANALEALVTETVSAPRSEMMAIPDENVQRVWHTDETQMIIDEKLVRLGKVPHAGRKR